MCSFLIPFPYLNAKFRQKFRSPKPACRVDLRAKKPVNSGKNSGIRWIRPIKIGNSGIFAGIPPQKRPLSLMPRGFAPPEFLPEFGASTMTKGRCSVMRVWWSDCEVLSAAELTQRAEQEGSVVMRVPAFGTYPHGLIVIQQAGAPLWAVPLRSNGSAAVFDVFQPIRCQWDRWLKEWQILARQSQVITASIP